MEAFSILFDWSCQRLVPHNRRKHRGRLECSKREVLSPLLPLKQDHCPSYGSSQFQATRGRISWSYLARYAELISSGSNLGIPEALHLQHFVGDPRLDSAFHVENASRGYFLHKTISEAKAILYRILKHTEYTGIYEDLPKESQEPTERAETFVQISTPCPQKIVELEAPTSDPDPFSKDHRPFFLSMFDDDESTVDGDVSSSPREESVTP